MLLAKRKRLTQADLDEVRDYLERGYSAKQIAVAICVPVDDIYYRIRRAWKKTSGYHRRSIAETQIGRYKQMIGDTLRARTLTNRPKHGWAVPCSTGCGRWRNLSPIR